MKEIAVSDEYTKQMAENLAKAVAVAKTISIIQEKSPLADVQLTSTDGENYVIDEYTIFVANGMGLGFYNEMARPVVETAKGKFKTVINPEGEIIAKDIIANIESSVLVKPEGI